MGIVHKAAEELWLVVYRLFYDTDEKTIYANRWRSYGVLEIAQKLVYEWIKMMCKHCPRH